jgi:hypothetical protein
MVDDGTAASPAQPASQRRSGFFSSILNLLSPGKPDAPAAEAPEAAPATQPEATTPVAFQVWRAPLPRRALTSSHGVVE